MNSIIQTNPYVLVDSEAKDKLSNKLTGEKILCGDKIIELVNFLKAPRAYESIEQEFSEIKEQLPQVIDALLAKKFLLKPDQLEEAVTTITPCTPHLFNLPFFSKSKKNEINDKGIVFVGVPLGIGNKTNQTASYYPNALRNYSEKYGIKLNAGSNFNVKSFGPKNNYQNLQTLIDEGRLFDIGNMFFDLNESPDFCYEKVESIASDLFKESEKQIPFFVGGDHSISYPLIKAAVDEFGNDLCVIHFDAHTDTYGSPYNQIKHGKKIHHHGNFLTKCFENGLKHAYQFGIRGMVNSNQSDTSEFQTIYWSGETKELIKSGHLFEELPKDKKYYVTFDFDVLDPLFFAGTTTPVINGFTLEECQYLINHVIKGRDIVGVDVVELYTDKGEIGVTHQIAIQFILDLLNAIA